MPWKKDSKLQQRFELVQAMLRNEKSATDLCQEAGVSRHTAYKFLRRFEETGRLGLLDRSRANRGRQSCGEVASSGVCVTALLADLGRGKVAVSFAAALAGEAVSELAHG
jgi:transposase-like protein